MTLFPRIAPGEHLRFGFLALLLAINAIVVQSNGVVATSGFLAHVGTEKILLVWAIDNAIIFSVSGAYALVIDRMKRTTVALWLFGAAALTYVAMYLLFNMGAPDALTYSLLILLNDQQWILFALAIWALASDVFNVAEAKRLFPLLGFAGLLGGIAGNGLAAAVAHFSTPSPSVHFAVLILRDYAFVAYRTSSQEWLLLLNAALMAVAVVILWQAKKRIQIASHQSRAQDTPVKVLRAGIDFVRDIPAFRNLAIIMLLVGIGLNTLEYQLIITAASAFANEAQLSAFYGTFRMVRMISMLAIQVFLSSWILKHVGFRSVFALVPTLMFLALFLPIWMPGILMIAAGEYLVRITMEGVDDPARRAFIGMVPDEQRGRVSAFFDGYLYPFGAVLSCGLIGLALALERARVIPQGLAQPVYLGVIAALVAISLYFAAQLRATYDASLLNWRLRRRKRASPLANLEF